MSKPKLKTVIELMEASKERLDMHKRRLEKFIEINAPKPILDNEEKNIKEIRRNFNAYALMIHFYKLGVMNGVSNDMSGMKMLHKYLSPEERLIAAIFDDPFEYGE